MTFALRKWLPLLVLIVNLGLIAGNLGMLWRIGQSQAKLQAAGADMAKAQARLEEATKAIQPCSDGIQLAPGESCFIKITAPLLGQSL